MSEQPATEADELARLKAAYDPLRRENDALRAANRLLRREVILARCELRDERDRQSGAWTARAWRRP